MNGDEMRDALARVMPEHQSWCHGEAHAECCGADDCDCGVADSLDRLLPFVVGNMRRYAALHLRDAADATVAATWPYPIVGADGPTVSDWLRERADTLDPR